MAGAGTFIDELKAMIESRRTFGRHPLWVEIAAGRLPREAFIEGAAATNLAAEGQVPGTFGPFARALEARYGLTRDQVAFWDVHEEADREHSDIGDHIVVRFADTPALQAKVRAAVERSLDLWWRFFDGICHSDPG